MIGRTLSHYRILEQLGEGGMGVVYLAEDLTLHRRVALKFLPPETQADRVAHARLVHEAQAAAALQHPHICPVYEIGEAEGQVFIVMAHLVGRTLRERIKAGAVPLAEALRLVRQIGEGLAAAHAQGIVHRDVKPGNVMLVREGAVERAVLMDFGLAKVAGSTRLTRTGTTLGTAAYMAPEQALGREADARADVWALGVVLYELVTGRLPFTGEYEVALLYAIAHAEAAAPTSVVAGLPAGLDGICAKALAKEPAKRYPTMEALVADVGALERDVTAEPAGRARWSRVRRRWGAVAVVLGTVVLAIGLTALNVGGLRERVFEGGPRIRSIAVLPLANLSGDPQQEYFADGMTAALINDLCKVEALRTVSQTSVMAYKKSRRSLGEIARELRVDAVVEGAVQRSGDRLRINAQLIRASGERQLWADSYDRDVQDVLALQGEIARAIASAVRVRLSSRDEARLAHTRRVVPEAYAEYLKGQQQLLSQSSTRGALATFRRAAALDPTFAAPHAGMSFCYSYLAVAGAAPGETGPEALAEAAEAVRLDARLAEAHAALAMARLQFAWDWAGAEQELLRALELNPNDPLTLDCQRFHLNCLGRFDDAISVTRREFEGRMDSRGAMANLAWVQLYARRFDRAIVPLESLLASDPHDRIQRCFLAIAYTETGRSAEAAALMDSLAVRDQLQDWGASFAVMVYGSVGQKEKARTILERMMEERGTFVDPYWIAFAYVGIGDKEQVLAWLQKALEVRSVNMVQAGIEFWGDAVRADPRFAEIMRKVGWPGRIG